MDFDFVIVGGGSAGSVLAARLSENPANQVCLIEAGGDGRGLVTRVPLGAAIQVPGRPPVNNWAYLTTPQKQLNGRRGFQPRGKALGGSSAINAMLYIRGVPSDYDGWAAAGCDGWSWSDVLPVFLRTEGNQRGAGPWHNDSGPLQVADQPSPNPITHAFVEASASVGLPRNDDFNGDTQEGVGLYQVTQFHSGPHKGERCSAAAAWLHPVMHRANLTVMTGVQAQGLVLEGRVARGVKIKRGGSDVVVSARREVIVSGGGFRITTIADAVRHRPGGSSQIGRHRCGA